MNCVAEVQQLCYMTLSHGDGLTPNWRMNDENRQIRGERDTASYYYRDGVDARFMFDSSVLPADQPSRPSRLFCSLSLSHSLSLCLCPSVCVWSVTKLTLPAAESPLSDSIIYDFISSQQIAALLFHWTCRYDGRQYRGLQQRLYTQRSLNLLTAIRVLQLYYIILNIVVTELCTPAVKCIDMMATCLPLAVKETVLKWSGLTALVNSFSTRLLSCYIDESAHTHTTFQTRWVSSDHVSESYSELRYLDSAYVLRVCTLNYIGPTSMPHDKNRVEKEFT